jgi:hypothetical protein
VGLDDDVEAAGADVAAEVWGVSFRKGGAKWVRSGRRTYYARGNERAREAMTSAMQIVAERETPTRQWTSVAVPFSLPFSATANVSTTWRKSG